VFEKDIRHLQGRMKNQGQPEIQQEIHHHHVNPQTETMSIARGIVRDYLYAGKYDEAKKALVDLWPPDTQLPPESRREQSWQDMVGGCCGDRAELKLEPGPLCNRKST
jgi:hypothetical protein